MGSNRRPFRKMSISCSSIPWRLVATASERFVHEASCDSRAPVCLGDDEHGQERLDLAVAQDLCYRGDLLALEGDERERAGLPSFPAGGGLQSSAMSIPVWIRDHPLWDMPG
jgi:hypothetical protein